MQTDVEIVERSCTCGDGCCSWTEIDIRCRDGTEIDGFLSISSAVEYCIENKLTYEIVTEGF